MRLTSRSHTRTLLGLALAAVAFLPLAAFAQDSDSSYAPSVISDATSDTLLASFTGTANGSTPRGSLVKSSSGLYYGVTSVGGTNNQGTLFCMTTAGVVTTLYNFGASVAFTYSGGTTVTPQQPYGALIQGTDGNFYGTTYTDATTGSGLSAPYASGVIFEFTPTGPATAPTGGTITILHQFLGNSIISPNTAGLQDAKHVEWALVEGTDGYLYGQSHGGGTGTSTSGLIFKIQKSGANYDIVHGFNAAGTDGNSPMGGLVESTLTAPDGTNYFYGMTMIGGANQQGNVFKVSASGTYFYDLADFNYNATTALAGPSEPYGTPVIGANGTTLYGVSFRGGIATTGTTPTSNDGVFFSIVDNGTTATVTPLYAFAGHSDPGKPEAGLILGSDGNFYGTSEAAGGNSDGSVFKVTPAGVESVAYAFKGGPTDGATPLDNPVESPSGDLYLTTSAGGSTGSSTVAGTGAAIKIATGLVTPISVVLSATQAAIGTPVTITYSSPIAHGATMSQCFATSVTPSGGTDPNWTGILTVSPSTQTATVTPTASGVYTYTLTCGGSNSSANETLTVPTDSFGAMSFSPAATEIQGTSVSINISETLTYSGTAPTGAVTYVLNGVTYTATCGTTSPATCTATVPATTIAALSPAAYTVTASLAAGGGYALTAGTSGTFTITPLDGYLTFSSVSHNFGQVAVGKAATAYGIKVTNSGTAAYPFAINFSTANGFTGATNCPASLAVGASCEIVFYFTPATAGTVSATWSLTAETGFGYTPSNGGTLTGAGTTSGGVSLTTNGHNFGTVTVGTQSPTYGAELSNSTASTVTLTLGSVSAPFTAMTNCGATLAAGASCELEFYFKPSTTSTVQQVYTLSGSTTITSGGVPLPNGGVTLTGN